MMILIKSVEKLIFDRFTNYDFRQQIKAIAGQWIKVETEYLFRDQYNTAPIKGVSETGLRIMDIHVEDVKNDARIGVWKCSYCGWQGKMPDDECCGNCQKHKDELYLSPLDETYYQWKKWADKKRVENKLEEQLQKFAKFGKSKNGNFLIVDTIGIPHSYCITDQHLKYNDSPYLNAYSIDKMERRHKTVRCGVNGCALSFAEHKHGLIVGCKIHFENENKVVPELHEYLLEIKDLAEQEKYEGFAFGEYDKWERHFRNQLSK